MDAIVDAAPYELAGIAQQQALENLIQARDTGNPARIRSAEHGVICEHLSFAAALGKRYRGRGIDGDDLEQLARLALVKAVKRWDPELCTDFLPYAYPTILGEIRRYFRDHSSTIRAPRGLRDLAAETQVVAAGLEQALGRTANDDDLARAVGVTPRQIRAQRMAVHRSLSLDIEAVQAVADQLPTESSESAFEQVENLLLIRRAVTVLTDRERRILQLRYFEEKSQKEIGQVVGVSQMQISRILREILTKLRGVMSDSAATTSAPHLPMAS